MKIGNLWGRQRWPGDESARATRVETERCVAVLGGGLAGVAAATVLAERGVRVTLFEREAFLGGRLGAWTETLPGAGPFQMERGFHAFFRQYYNLRALMRRVDPGLSRLLPMDDYPILGPEGEHQSFADLSTWPLANLLSLMRNTDTIGLRDLFAIDGRRAAQMISFDESVTYGAFDDLDAGSFLDSLNFPSRARRLLFDVFAHSFFNPERSMSAAEMLMMFHFYFFGNPEGLVFDVLDGPFSEAFWKPMGAYLRALGVELRTQDPVREVAREGQWRVQSEAGEHGPFDALVLALPVEPLKTLVGASSDLREDPSFGARVNSLRPTAPFAVWRLFLDRKPRSDRAPFAGTGGLGILDNISIYERFEGESRRWAEQTGGSVVELHAYALAESDERKIKRQLRAGLDRVYPELAGARALHDVYLLRQDCPAFEPRAHWMRPEVSDGPRGVTLAGDFVRLPFPSALMERAVSSGILAANHLLRDWDVRGEPLWTVPRRGLLPAQRFGSLPRPKLAKSMSSGVGGRGVPESRGPGIPEAGGVVGLEYSEAGGRG